VPVFGAKMFEIELLSASRHSHLQLVNVKAVSGSVAHNLVFRQTPIAILEFAAFVSTDIPLRCTGYLSQPGSSRELSLCVERNFISVVYVQPFANFIRLLITPRNLRKSRSFSSSYVNPAVFHSIH
jgi:hypothetical protein